MASSFRTSVTVTVGLKKYRARTIRVDRRQLYEVAGYRYPGVTKILSATKPLEARAALSNWRRSVGVEAAKQISGKASSAGTRLHKQIASFLDGRIVDLAPDIEGYWKSIEPVLQETGEALLIEGAVWHEAGYVGFPDALLVYDHKICVCDWKTALKPKKFEWIGDYCLQVAAYAKAVEQVYVEEGIQVEGALIAIALEDMPAQTFRLSQEEVDEHWILFQKRLAEYQILQSR